MRAKTCVMLALTTAVWLLATSPAAAQGRPDIVWMRGGHGDSVLALSFLPDHQTLASASADFTIKLWSVADGSIVRSLLNGDGSAIAFSPDGQSFATAGPDGTIFQLNLGDSSLLQTFAGHTDYVNALAFSQDGQFLASGSNDL